MKIGEALSERAGLSRKVNQYRQRLTSAAIYRQGEEPTEDAQVLLREANEVADRLRFLIGAINKTNAATRLPNGDTITDALARRDSLNTRIATYDEVSRAIVQRDQFRYRAAELPSIAAVDVGELQATMAELVEERRALDVTLQTLSWTTDLIE